MIKQQIAEIVSDCVFTGYDNAGELINKTTDEILSLIIKEIEGKKKSITQHWDDFDNGVETGFNKALDLIIDMLKRGE